MHFGCLINWACISTRVATRIYAWCEYSLFHFRATFQAYQLENLYVFTLGLETHFSNLVSLSWIHWLLKWQRSNASSFQITENVLGLSTLTHTFNICDAKSLLKLRQPMSISRSLKVIRHSHSPLMLVECIYLWLWSSIGFSTMKEIVIKPSSILFTLRSLQMD